MAETGHAGVDGPDGGAATRMRQIGEQEILRLALVKAIFILDTTIDLGRVGSVRVRVPLACSCLRSTNLPFLSTFLLFRDAMKVL